MFSVVAIALLGAGSSVTMLPAGRGRCGPFPPGQPDTKWEFLKVLIDR